MSKTPIILYFLLLMASLSFSPKVLGQSKTDSLSQLIKKEGDPSKKASFFLERATTYGIKDTAVALGDIEKAVGYFHKMDDRENLVNAHLARGKVYFKSRDYHKACREDSLAIKLSERIGFEEGRTIAIGKLGWTQFVMGNIEEADKNVGKAVSLEEKFEFNDIERLVDLYGLLGVIKGKMGDPAKSLMFLEKGVELGESLKNKRGLIRIYANYANALDQVSRSEEAMEAHLKAIRLSEKHKDTVWLMREYNNIAILFKNLKEYDRAYSYYEKSLDMATQRKDYKSMGLTTMNMALVNQNTGKFDKIDSLYGRALEYFSKIDDKYGKSLVYQNHGNHLVHMKKYAQAEEKLLKALEITKSTGSDFVRTKILSVLGNSMVEQGRLGEAEKHLLEVKMVYDKSGGTDQQWDDLYLYLKKLYFAKGDYKKAYEYQEKELGTKQKMFEESKKVNSLKLQAEYQLEKRDLQMAAEEERQRKSKLYIFSIGGFIVLVLILILTILVQRRKQSREHHKAELVRLRQEHRLGLADSLTKAEQEERRKIASKLHDETGGILSIAKLNLDQLKDKVFVAGSDSGKKLESTKKLLTEASESIRNISHSLMPVALEKYGLKAALQDLTGSINTSGKIKVEEVLEGLDDTRNWSPQLTLAIYRMVQEVFNNIIKHSQATNILLQIVELKESVTIYIEDNGKGLNEGQIDTGGMGLSLLKKNIEYLNGKVEINGKENKGTFVLAELPIILKEK